MEVSFGSHFVYSCRYHIVLPTKYRRKIFNDGIFEFFKKCVENTLQANPQIQIIEINHDRDHVHMLVSIPPSVSVGSVVRMIKSDSARHMREQFAFLKKLYTKGGIWSDGYFVSTTGINEEIIKQYIEHQGKKDAGQLKLYFT
jgi:putative transposase